MSDKELWSAVDQYIIEQFIPADQALDDALRASQAAGLPAINVSAAQGKFLHLLARIRGARKILEIGTLGGYSTIWLARALPKDGRLITLEFDPKHAAVAQSNIEGAGLSDVVEIIQGRAIDTLQKMVSENRGPFDLIFIDADKPSTADYFEWSLKLARPGSVIIVDNVVRSGGVIDAKSADTGVQGIRRFNARLAAEKSVDATALQTVGSKGYDGFAVVLVK